MYARYFAHRKRGVVNGVQYAVVAHVAVVGGGDLSAHGAGLVHHVARVVVMNRGVAVRAPVAHAALVDRVVGLPYQKRKIM